MLEFFFGALVGAWIVGCVVFAAITLAHKTNMKERREERAETLHLLRTANEHRQDTAVALRRITSHLENAERRNHARAAMQGILADKIDRSDELLDGETCPQAVARLSVEHADELTAALHRGEAART